MGPEEQRGGGCAAAVLCVALSGHHLSCGAQDCQAALESLAAAAAAAAAVGGTASLRKAAGVLTH